MIKFFKEPGYEVKSPARDNGNAGIDFYIPSANKVFADAFAVKNETTGAKLDETAGTITIPPHSDANIPSGIRSRFDADTGLIAVNKSGIAMKKKLVCGACLIDPNYQGIIHCHMINTSDKEVVLECGTKIVQFVPYKFDTTAIETVVKGMSYDEFYKDFEFDNRGDGAFGSTTIY